MSTHVSLATAIDKSKVASAAVYLLLLEVDVYDLNGTLIETLYVTNNNEPYTFQGQTYSIAPFEITLTQSRENTPSAQLVVHDLGQVFQAALQAYGVVLDWPARIKVVNVANSTPTIDMQQNFSIISAQAKDTDYSITFTLAGENPLTLRFPPRDEFQDICFWVYKGPQCTYSGTLTSCDYSMDGANGCRVHANTLNFGGFPGIQRSTA